MSISTVEKFEIFRSHWEQINNYFPLLDYSVKQEIASIENTDFLKTNYTSRNKKITASFAYFPLDAYNNVQESIYGHLYSETPLTVSIIKFSEVEFNCTKEDFSLLKYSGSFEQKASSFCAFLLPILSSQKLQTILEGSYWSNDYYVPWYEGTDF